MKYKRKLSSVNEVQLNSIKALFDMFITLKVLPTYHIVWRSYMDTIASIQNGASSTHVVCNWYLLYDIEEVVLFNW